MNNGTHRFSTLAQGAVSTDSLAGRKKDARRASWLGWTGAALGLLILNSPAGAQDAALAKISRAGPDVLEEIVVTARQREEGVQSVPIPISAISGTTLADQAAFDITDITRLAPNLQINIDAQTKTATSVFLRGIGQTNASPSSDPKVAIYLDGAYLARPVGTVFDLVDVERVEVLRGPQGTLFGRNTTAGLIHIIHNRPAPEFDASVRVMAGNDGQLTYAGMLNLPLTETLAARFSGQHREDDGYTENTFTGEGWNDKGADTFRGALLWSPSEDFSAELVANYDRTREHPNLVGCEWGAPENGADALFPPGPLSAIFIYGQYDQNRDNCNASGPYQAGLRGPAESRSDAYGAAATLEWDLGFAQLTSITAWRYV
jgi:iron complex outermembrane receptor protein